MAPRIAAPVPVNRPANPPSGGVEETDLHPAQVWGLAALAAAVIGYFDFVTGTELRVYPLYFIPVSLVAWHRGRRGALIAATFCSLTWMASNFQAGREYSQPALWVVNTCVQGGSFATVGMLIATLRQALQRERELSRVDPLTALRNARAFYEEAGRALASCRRKGRPITIAYIDLDNFKSVNDRLGHQAGDDLLRAIGGVLQTSIRPSDLAARLGGDEFAVLLPEVGAKESEVTLERLRAVMSQAVDTRAVPVSVSIGAVSYLVPPAEIEVMVHDADARMYEAKASGKNRVRLDVDQRAPARQAADGPAV